MSIYVNTNNKLIKSGGRKAVKVSIDFLKDKFKEILLKSDYYDSDISSVDDALKSENLYVYAFFECSSKIRKDLNKIEFDFENATSVPDEFVDYGGLLIGFHTLDNGFSFLGCLAGGDWEFPVFFIIYYDGKSLRGYIPICGNIINRDNMSAFGNYDDDDFLKKELGKKYAGQSIEDVEYNWELIENDIKNRIIII